MRALYPERAIGLPYRKIVSGEGEGFLNIHNDMEVGTRDSLWPRN